MIWVIYDRDGEAQYCTTSDSTLEMVLMEHSGWYAVETKLI